MKCLSLMIVNYCQSLACNYQKLWFFRVSFEYFQLESFVISKRAQCTLALAGPQFNIIESSKSVKYWIKRHRTKCHVGQVGIGQVAM